MLLKQTFLLFSVITLVNLFHVETWLLLAKEKINYEKCGIDYVCTYEFIIPPKFENIKGFSEGLASVKVNGKYGFINKKGKVVIPHEFDDAGFFSEGLADVKINGKYGFINKKGKIVILPEFDYVWLSFKEDSE